MELGRYLPSLLSAILLLSGCERTQITDTPAKEYGDRIVAPYGSWQSPLSAVNVFEQADSVAELQSVGNAIYFAESSGKSQGKVGIKRLDKHANVVEVVSPEFNVKSTVHEYGGAAFLGIGQSLFATKLQDQLFYRFAPNQPPLPLTLMALVMRIVSPIQKVRALSVCVKITAKKVNLRRV
ncbi:peptidase S9 [Shewanella putrefaciens]|nr:peptidase S9 [Shewanella putrefaciens]